MTTSVLIESVRTREHRPLLHIENLIAATAQAVKAAVTDVLLPVYIFRRKPEPDFTLRHWRALLETVESRNVLDTSVLTQLNEALSMLVVELPEKRSAWSEAVLDSLSSEKYLSMCFIHSTALRTAASKSDVQSNLDELRADLEGKISQLDSKAYSLLSTMGHVDLQPSNIFSDFFDDASEEPAGWADAPTTAPVSPMDPLEAARAVRDRLLESEQWLTSEQVATQLLSGAATSNPAQYASDLRKKGRLFGVKYRGEYLHPAFQFQAHAINPMVSKLLPSLPTTEANWNAAFWLFQPTGGLGGKRPADVFAANPNAVVDAAKVAFTPSDDEGTPSRTAMSR